MFPPEDLLLLVSEEEFVPEQQECRHPVEGGQEEVDITAVTVKIEEEEEVVSSQLHLQSLDRGGAEPGPGPGPGSSPVLVLHSQGFDPQLSAVWGKNAEATSHGRHQNGSRSSARHVDQRSNVKTPRKVQPTARRPFSCPQCSKPFTQRVQLIHHMSSHQAALREDSRGAEPAWRPVGGAAEQELSENLAEITDSMDSEESSGTSDTESSSDSDSGDGDAGVWTDSWKPSGRKVAKTEAAPDDEEADKPFRCLDCGRRFKAKVTLKSHMTIHTGVKPFTCFLCGKKFSRKPYLKSHMITHAGDRPFKCSFCGKGLRTKASLQEHQRIHTGEKPFDCPECGRSFRSKGCMTIHMRTHR